MTPGNVATAGQSDPIAERRLETNADEFHHRVESYLEALADRHCIAFWRVLIADEEAAIRGTEHIRERNLP
jgi:hypothetical protein